jgi:hypothetical protein
MVRRFIGRGSTTYADAVDAVGARKSRRTETWSREKKIAA